MSATLHKKSILKKTFQVGSSTLLSRVFGVIREALMVRFLGAGAVADAFFTAWKIPNSLRKMFAEGALSASFIPTLVRVVRQDKKQASSLVSLGFLVFEGLLLVLCAFAMWKAHWVLKIIVPGFSAEQIAYTIPMLRILMPFILFMSSSALLACALQSVGHFFVPAFAQVLLNIVFILALIICMQFGLSVDWFCVLILFAGLVQFIAHLYTYFTLHFTFAPINSETRTHFKSVLLKFFPVFFSMSVMEINLFIDTSFASYLPAGSVSLLSYANRFMGIPLGVFAVAFSTILLPHFARVGSYAPKRLSYYLLETTKFVFWVTVPATIVMVFFAEKIFHTIFLSDKFNLAQVYEAQLILIAFLIGLFFFSLNKILLNLYYALHVTWVPTIISIVATVLNFILNYVLMAKYQATGLALATTISSGLVQTILFVGFLYCKYDFKFYTSDFFKFFIRYIAQLTLILSIFYFIYRMIENYIATLSSAFAQFLLFGLGFWFWVGPLCGICLAAIYFSRTLFGVQLYFLNND